MTSPAGRGQLGDARRAAHSDGRRIGRPEMSAAGVGGRPVRFEPDPPTEPMPAVPDAATKVPDAATKVPDAATKMPDAATKMMSWSPPRVDGVPPLPEPEPKPALPDPVRTVKATVRTVWALSDTVTPPAAIRLSYRWWLLALVFGLAAIAVSVVAAWDYHHRTGVTLAGGTTAGDVVFEMLALLVAAIVVRRMRAGDEWARTVLALVGGLIAFMVALNSMTQISFLSSAPAVFRTVTAIMRLMEVGAAGMAIWYMFQPGAAKHFDPRRRGD